MPGFEVTATSGTTAVRGVLCQVFTQLRPLCLDPETAAAVELVLAEVLNNIVEHAYAIPCKETPLSVRCRYDSEGLHFTVADRGVAMPDWRIPPGNAQRIDLPLADLPEGGFGWFLIHDIAQDLSYERRNGENRLSLRLSIAT